MATHCVFGSDGIELHFRDKEMYERYQEDCRKLAAKYYREIRERHGVWASNQGKFVRTADDLKPGDSRFMENFSEAHPDDSLGVAGAITHLTTAIDLVGEAKNLWDCGVQTWDELETINDRLHDALTALGVVTC